MHLHLRGNFYFDYFFIQTNKKKLHKMHGTYIKILCLMFTYPLQWNQASTLNRTGMVSVSSAHTLTYQFHKIQFCVVKFVNNSCLMWLSHLLLPNVIFWAKENEHFIFMAENNAQPITLWAGVSMHHLIGMCIFEGLLMEQSNCERNGTGQTSVTKGESHSKCGFSMLVYQLILGCLWPPKWQVKRTVDWFVIQHPSYHYHCLHEIIL
jgi:hypothetical protein